MSVASDDDTVLPHCEQVSRGQELLHMLVVNSSPEDTLTDHMKSLGSKAAGVDLTVVVKNSFIEVVPHPVKQRLTRSLSDSMLLDFKSDLEQPWTSEEPWKQNLVDKFADLSDVSTNVSLEAEDYTLWSGTEAIQNASVWCATGYDTDVIQGTLQPPQEYQCVESWWMPHFDENFLTFSQGMQCRTAVPETGFAPGAWVEEGKLSQVHSSDEQLMSTEWRTTVMVRNMPNNYTREMLLDLLDSVGFAAGSYDFVYLPIDFKSQAGLGYAFVNFVSSAEALRCFDLLEGFSDWRVPSEKVCTVMWGSPYQGLEAHIERYRSSPVMHHSIPDEWKPMLFQGGVRVCFPSPDKHIKMPKIRKV